MESRVCRGQGEGSVLVLPGGALGSYVLCPVTFQCRAVKSPFLPASGNQPHGWVPECDSAGRSLAVCTQENSFASVPLLIG